MKERRILCWFKIEITEKNVTKFAKIFDNILIKALFQKTFFWAVLLHVCQQILNQHKILSSFLSTFKFCEEIFCHISTFETLKPILQETAQNIENVLKTGAQIFFLTPIFSWSPLIFSKNINIAVL